MPVVTSGFLVSTFGLTAGATATALASVATFLVQGAIYFTVSTGIQKVFGKTPKGLGDFQGRMQMVREPLAPRQVVYGQCRVSGPLVLAHTTGTNNEYLSMIVALAGHEVEEIGDVYFNDEIVVDQSAHATDPIAKYSGYVDCVKLLGTDAQAADSTMTTHLGAKWTANHRLRGIAAVYVRLKWNQDLFPGGIPQISCVVKGKPLYDFRDASTAYGTNPVLALYDFMTDTRYGLGIGAAELDTASGGTWDTAADECDEAVSLDAGGSEDRYTVNGSTDTAVRPSQTVETLIQAMQGRMYYVAGEYHLYAGAYEASTVSFDEDDLRGPITTRSDIARRDKANSIKGTYANPDDNWTPVDFPSYVNSAYETIDDETLWRDITLPWTTSSTMAQRIAKIALLDNRQTLTVSMPCKLTAMKAKIGDTVDVTNTRFGWTNKVFLVTGYAFVPAGGGGPGIGVDMELRETASEVYDWSTTEEEAVASSPNTDLPDPWTVADPTGLTLASGQTNSVARGDGFWDPRLKVSWTAPTDQFVQSGGYIEIQYKLSSEASGDYQQIGQVEGDHEAFFISSVGNGLDYDVRIRAINSLGVKGDWVEETDHTIVTDATGPGLVGVALTLDTVEPVNQTREIWVTLTPPADQDYSHTKATWTKDGAKEQIGFGTRMFIRDVGLGAITITFYAVDTVGNVGSGTGLALGAITQVLVPGVDTGTGDGDTRFLVDSDSLTYGDRLIMYDSAAALDFRIGKGHDTANDWYFVFQDSGTGPNDPVFKLIQNAAGIPASLQALVAGVHFGGFGYSSGTKSGTMKFDRSDDKLWWGPGTDSFDTNLYRSAADLLKTDDDFECNDLHVNGDLTVDGSSPGGGGGASWMGFSGAAATVTKGSTDYLGFGSGGVNATEGNAVVYFRRSATIQDLDVYVSANGTGAAGNTVTIRKNGSATALQVTYGSGETGQKTDTDSFTVVSGDYISIEVVNTGSGGGTKNIVVESVGIEIS